MNVICKTLATMMLLSSVSYAGFGKPEKLSIKNIEKHIETAKKDNEPLIIVLYNSKSR